LGDSTKFGAKTWSGAASGAPNTVRCPDRAPSQLASLGFFRDTPRYNSPDCPVCTGQCPVSQRSNDHCAQWSTAKVYSARSEVRAGSQNLPDMSSVLPDCLVQLEDKGLQRSTAPNPNGVLTWHAPDSEQCHVRCTTELSGAPSIAMARIVVGAINTPNHLHSSHPSFLNFTFNTRAIAFTQRHIPKIKPFPSLKINSIA
jgi:hypothetical protein